MTSKEMYARADEEWDGMTTKEQIAEIDPDGDQDLLSMFLDYCEAHKANDALLGYASYAVKAFLDDEWYDKWMDWRVADMFSDEANRADQAYAEWKEGKP